jgi:ribosomal protein S19E (S16A)
MEYGHYGEISLSATLYDFFFDRNYEISILKEIEGLISIEELKRFIQEVQIRIVPESGQRLLQKMAEDIINLYRENSQFIDIPKEYIQQLLLQLELDGYVYKNGQLLPIENSVINQHTEQTYLEILIDSLSLSDSKFIKHHLNLSGEHFSNGKWGDCISNSRMALEAILQQVADAIHVKRNGAKLSQNLYSKPVEVRKYLENENFFDTKETKTISEVYGLLSDTGSHPNISAKDQARLMRNLALSLSQYALITYEGFLKNNP